MKIAVIGAGAVGSMFGGLIKHHVPDAEMLFLARGAHGAAMARQGHVLLQGFWGEAAAPIKVTEHPADLRGVDAALFTVKSQDAEATAQAIAKHVGHATIVSLQNGINQPILSRFLRPERLVVGMTATNMAIREPGVVSLQRNGITVVGPGTKETTSETVGGTAGLLERSGLPVARVQNILGIQYNKLLVNTVGYASVLSNSDMLLDCVLCRSWRRNVALPLLSEGIAAIRRSGIQIERTRGLSDVFRFRRLLRILDLVPFEHRVRRFVERRFHPKRIVYSVYQDLMRGKPTEIDFVNGEIVRLAAKSGMSAPCNREVVAAVRELERRESGCFFSQEEVLRRLRRARAAGETVSGEIFPIGPNGDA